MKIKFGLLLIMLALASENREIKIESAKCERLKEENDENLILVKIEEDEYMYTKAKVTKMVIS